VDAGRVSQAPLLVAPVAPSWPPALASGRDGRFPGLQPGGSYVTPRRISHPDFTGFEVRAR
jgi:hypothetical protein